MFLHHPMLRAMGIDHGFGTLQSLPRPGCSTLRQVHGTDILVRSRPRPGRMEGSGDGLIASETGVEVGVWTADCLPVLVSTESGSHVGAFHAGWRGAAAGIALKGLRRMMDEWGLHSASFRVVLGPAIGPCCYEVGRDVWEAVRTTTSDFRPGNEATLDLWDLVTHQLLSAGVPAGHIGRISLCTRCHPELFYSHRGWGPKREGRSMLNYIRSTGHDRT